MCVCGGGGGHFTLGGTVCPSVCVCVCVWGGGGGHFTLGGGQLALVQNVRGDILHGGTIHPPTPALALDRLGKCLGPPVRRAAKLLLLNYSYPN